MIKPERPEAGRVLEALGLRSSRRTRSRDWLAITMTGGQHPRSGPGSHPGSGDLARAVAIVLEPESERQRGDALVAIARIAQTNPGLLLPPDELGHITLGGRLTMRADDERAGTLGARRAEVARLSDDDRATVAHAVAVLDALAAPATRDEAIRLLHERAAQP